VAGVQDPNPLVNGRGVEYLQAHNVEVSLGVRREAAERLNAAFFTAVKLRRPYVIAKIAMSLDGRIAARPGMRTPLTSPESLRRAHRLRAEVDAIGIGSGTLLADDPELTARVAYRHRPLTRVVFDRRLRTPPSARLLSTGTAGPVIIVTTSEAVRDQPERADLLSARGASLEIVDRPDFVTALDAVYRRGATSLLLEGGTDLHRAAWKAGVIDRVQVFIAPTILGDQGVPWLDAGTFSLAALRDCRVEHSGADVHLDGYVHRTD
jgi:diaminohydroxyphosphoribosylaminopyrimidine deaminase/5-amino-6-(5-phosphoribosylamino)uracil reductase